MLKTSKKLLLPAAYTLYMSIGITLVMMQLFSGSFMESFRLSMTELGTLLSCQFIAGIILPIFLGRISDVIGKKKVLIISIAMYSLGCFIAGFSKSLIVCEIGIFLMGGGNASANGVFSAAISDAYPENASRYISFTAMCVSGFNMIVSLVSSIMGSSFPDWRTMFLFAGCFILIPLVLTALARIERKDEGLKAAEGIGELIKAVRNPALILICLATVLVSAMCMVYPSYAEGFFKDVMNAPGIARIIVFVHSFLSFASNTVFGIIKLKEETKLRICAFGGGIFLILELLQSNATVALVLGIVFSFVQAAAFPMCISIAAKTDPANSGTATSLALVSNNLGSALGSYVTGAVADLWDLRGGYLFIAVCGLLSGLTVIIMERYKRKRTKA